MVGVGWASWRERAERALRETTNAPVRPYSTRDFGRERHERCLSVVLPEEEARALLPRVRSAAPPGSVAFIGTTKWLGDERRDGGAELVLGPGGSQFDALRLAATDACNHDLGTEELISKLEEYDEEHGIDVYLAETDTVEFALLSIPEDLPAFAADLYEFCPDIVDQGIGSVAELAEVVGAFGVVYLWWD